MTATYVSPFLAVRRESAEDGTHVWSARDLKDLLGYERMKWQHFVDSVIESAKSAAHASKLDVDAHFREVEVRTGRRGRPSIDFHLTRRAALLVAMSADITRARVYAARQFFRTGEGLDVTAIPVPGVRREDVDGAPSSPVIPRRVAERAVSHVETFEPTGCQISVYSPNTSGEAQLGWAGDDGVGKSTLAHRAAWVYYTGEQIPRGSSVRHRCGTRSCVREDHLQLVPNWKLEAYRHGRLWPLGRWAVGA